MARSDHDDRSPMRARRRTVLRGLAGGALTVAAVDPVRAGGDTQYVVNAAGTAVEDRIEDAGFTVQRTLAGGKVYSVLGPADDREELEEIEGITHVAEDVQITFEGSELAGESEAESEDGEPAYFDFQWDKQAFTTNAIGAHEDATGEGAKIAVLDSGIDANHPDLEANVVTDEWRTYNAAGEFSEGEHDDRTGHGTHVAGIAAASGDVGVVGTAPDAELISLRVLNDELSGTVTQFLTAIEDAADIGADAANQCCPRSSASRYTTRG